MHFVVGPCFVGSVAGCGMQESYVLRQPLDIHPGQDYRQVMSLPVGTRVR
jgi:hypothetical protein